MGNKINGREIADKIKDEVRSFVKERQEANKILPKIASILVGNDGGSVFYLNSQEKVATSLNVGFEKIQLENTISEKELINIINDLNTREDVSGIMIQVPLPNHINEEKVVNMISPLKDIDCLTYINQGKLYTSESKGYLPCTANSVIRILKDINIDLNGKKAVVIGRSNIVGKPLFSLLLKENCTVTICHSKTKDLREECKSADILISAIGKPKFINDEYIKDGAIVIDVGTSLFEGKITGDIDFEKVIDKVSFITPVPGGVGALTTTLLIKNSCEALVRYED